jgi:glycine/betaine/sarcosine/D-proline reductase family selenoprotein B
MAREFEQAGIPTALISALPEIPTAMGVPRVIRGVAITHLLGDPRLPAGEERRLRTAIVRAAVHSLRESPDRPTVFPVT